MIDQVSECLLLRPQDLNPWRDDLKSIGVRNPRVVKVNDEIILLVCVAETPRDRRPGSWGHRDASQTAPSSIGRVKKTGSRRILTKGIASRADAMSFTVESPATAAAPPIVVVVGGM